MSTDKLSQDELVELGKRLLKMAYDAGERPSIDMSLDYMFDLIGKGWSIQVKIPHAPSGQPDLILPGKVQFVGNVTTIAWEALEEVKRTLAAT